MRFSTDDGSFGFIVTSLTGAGMYRFQIVLAGELVGNKEPCFLGSAMRRFGKIKQLDDERLDSISTDPAGVLKILMSDEVLHDAALLEAAESFDGWIVRGYLHRGNVTILAKIDSPWAGAVDSRIFVSTVPSCDYDSIFTAVHSYWEGTVRGKN